MLINKSAAPICPRCGGSVMSPVAWPAITIGGDVYLILCPSCGCVMGSINKTQDPAEPETLTQERTTFSEDAS